MDLPNEEITFETQDGAETVELEGDTLDYDPELRLWKIPQQKFEEEDSVEYREIPEHRVYEVKRTESAATHTL